MDPVHRVANPVTIIVLMQVYAISGSRSEFDGYLDVLEHLRDMGMVVVDDSGYPSVTEKGKTWAEMLCRTPFPVQKFVDPREEEK